MLCLFYWREGSNRSLNFSMEFSLPKSWLRKDFNSGIPTFGLQRSCTRIEFGFWFSSSKLYNQYAYISHQTANRENHRLKSAVYGRGIWDTSLEATKISNIDTPQTSPENTAEKESIQSKHGDDFSPVTPPKINSSPLKNDGWED